MRISRRIIYAVFILFIMINTIYSQHFWYVKTGLNYSTLNNLEDIKPGLEYNFSIGREWSIYENLYLTLGLEYSVKSFTLENRTIGPVSDMGVYPLGRSVYNYDIEGKISFIEIPLNLKYKFDINQKWKMSIQFGGSRSYPIKDFTKLNRKEYLYEYENKLYDKIFRFKLIENTFSDYKPGYTLNIGLGLIYQNYGLDIEYQKDMREEIFVDSLLGIKGEVNSFRLSLVIYI
jgi:Outer membrane protein beta-barrel domain